MSQKYLTTRALSARWGGKPTVGTLRNWRSKKKGPRSTKHEGIVVYEIEAVEAYERQQKLKDGDT